MYLENNNIKVLRIFFKFSIEKKILKTLYKILENSENILENIEIFFKFSIEKRKI